MSKNKTIFASDLGLRPSVWPKQIQFEDAIWYRGREVRDSEREMQYVEYTTEETPWTTKKLIVFND